MGQDFKLFASKETRAAIPPEDLKLLEELLPQWAGRNVILVSAKDTNRVTGDPSKISPDKLYTKDFRSFLSHLPLEKSAAGDDRAGLQQAYKRAAQGHGDFSAFGSDTFRQTGIMTVSARYDDLNRYIPAGLAGLPQSMIANVPGSSTDWMLATVAHEAGHLNSVESDARNAANLKGRLSEADAISVANNDREIAADQKGLTNYFTLQAQRPSIDPKVPAAFMALRAIGTIHQSGDALSAFTLAPTDHGTSPAINISGTSVNPVTGMHSGKIDSAVVDMNTRVHMLIGLESRSQLTSEAKTALDKQTDSILARLNNPQVTKLASGAGISPDSIYDAAIGDGRAAMLRRAGSSPAGRDAMQMMMLGDVVAKKDPLTEYAAVKFLYAHGEFKTDAQRKIADDYLKAFEKYVPAASGQPVRDYIAKLEKDWPEIQRQERNMPLMQQSIDVSKAQLREPNAVLEASVPPSTGTG